MIYVLNFLNVYIQFIKTQDKLDNNEKLKLEEQRKKKCIIDILLFQIY